MFASIMKDWDQIVESTKLYKGYYEIVSTFLAEECNVEHLKLEDELEKKKKVRFNIARLF